MFTEKRPSILRVLQVDYWSFIAAIFIVIFWAFYLYDAFMAQKNTPNMLLVALIATGAAAGVLLWRYASILALYANGVDTKATIHLIGFHRDRGRIAYIYTVEGQKYLSGNTVMKTRRTKSYRIGEQVDILVDYRNPKRAIIRDLYL